MIHLCALIYFFAAFVLNPAESHPQFLRRLRLPDLNKSTPEEVNSLELQEPIQRSRSIDTSVQHSNSVELTIKEVEDIIKADPSLPRLTRGEILDLLDNITKEDHKKKNGINDKSRDPKAIMLVMPFTPSKDEKNLADLYTKAPITQIVGAGEPFNIQEETTSSPINNKQQRRRPSVKFSETINNKNNDIIDDKTTSTTTMRSRRRRPQVTTSLTTTSTENSVEIEASTYRPTRGRRPIRRKPTTSTTTQHPNHRYPQDFEPNNSGIRIIEPPNLVTAHKINEDLSFAANTRNEVTWKSVISRSTTTETPVIEDINLPDNLKNIVKNMDLESALNQKLEKSKTPSIEEQNKIKDMLASIGIIDTTMTTTTTTTTTELTNAESVADNLSPEMRDLLMSFGLLPNPNEKPAPIAERYNPEKAEVKPESYVGFKPLPDDGPSRDDMDALLASFGLGRSARKKKSMKVKTEDKQSMSFDMIPDNLKGVISDLGLERDNFREEKKIRTTPLEKNVEKKQHVFNPDTQYASEEELKKLEKLMGVIKQLEKLNGTATDEDLKKIDFEGLKELVKSLNDSNTTETSETLDSSKNFGPDPNNFDSGIVKNEVKRQEATTTTESPSSSTTEEAKNPSLVDLEASFGGQTEVTTEAKIPETTTARKNGFYRLVDWNTFLDIDDTKGRHVNLRFQPKFGDPKRFYSVTVP